MANTMLSTMITADSSGFQKAVTDAEKVAVNFEKKMKNFSSKLGNISGKLSGIGTQISASLTEPIRNAGQTMVSAVDEFDRNLGKIQETFGSNANAVTTWAQTAVKQFGLSKNQALSAASTFGDMAVSMGLTQPMAASMSTSLAGLAVDLSSFKNVNVNDAMSALSGVFTGETEGLKQLGIVMTETNLADFAAKTGQVYSQMSAAEKAQLRYNYVMETTKNMQGAYAGAADGTTNSIQTFQAAVDNLMLTLGQYLLPVFTPLIQKAADLVTVFVNADPKFQQIAIRILGVVAAMGPLLSILGNVFGGIGNVVGVLAGLSGKISALGGMKAVLSSVFATITGPVGVAVAAITALVGAFIYLMSTNESFRNSIMGTVAMIGTSLQPVISILMTIIMQLITMIGSVIGMLLQNLAPVISQIVLIIGQLIVQLAPLITQLISQLAPVITTIITTVSQIISSLMPILIAIITTVMNLLAAFMPTITNILTVAIGVIQGIIAAVTPIISFIAGVVSSIIANITPIASTVFSVFSGIFSTVSNIMGNIGRVVGDVFSRITSAWNGLTSFVSGIFGGIANAVDSLVGQVKGFVNGVIGGINSAIRLINKIPGVEISTIPYLAHGTDNWAGGFARINEGGRGELTYLPNGTQVIPHDISVKYAKEAARRNANAESIDLTGIFEGTMIKIINNTSIDGTPLKEVVSDYVIRRIGRQQRAVQRAKGVC